jgi:uncharacterized membrane-anchored protein YhcB (DUF1043 family)
MNGAQCKQDEKWYLSIWKHPLMLLVIGSAVSYLLVPLIGERVSHKRVLQEQRVNIACDIQKQALIVDEQLHAMATDYALFSNGAAVDPLTYRDAQAELRRSSRRLYLEFDQHAWYWTYDLPLQSRLLELPPGTESRIIELNRLYSSSLSESTKQLDVMANRFLSKDYDPRNPKNREVWEGAYNKINELANQRAGTTNEMAGLFMPSGAHW